ncbi:MAG: type IV pilus biogenesis protein PilM [Acetivibrionales bacterium]|jgi:type IV pilus assembly protein PilM|nr:pilus assembly protein PilM [Clostridiaceae bacterium]
MGILKNSIIGLVLDSQEIRAIELKGSQKKPVVVAWGKVKLPEGVVKEGRIVNAQLFNVSLERLFLENGFKGRDIYLGVNNQDIIVRFASFPKVPEDKIRNMIHFQAQEHMPVSIEELVMDYVVVSEKKTDEGEFINVVLVGARKKMLNDYIDAFSLSNTNIKEIDATMLALGRAALIDSNDGTFVLAGFNNDIGNILIFSNGILAMARSVNINQPPEWIESNDEKVQSNEKDSNIYADILFGEIKSSVAYYKMQSGKDIEKIYVLGCVAKQDEVASRLKETTGLAVSVPMPYTFLENRIIKGKMNNFKASDYVPCISLAMRGLGE